MTITFRQICFGVALSLGLHLFLLALLAETTVVPADLERVVLDVWDVFDDDDIGNVPDLPINYNIDRIEEVSVPGRAVLWLQRVQENGDPGKASFAEVTAWLDQVAPPAPAESAPLPPPTELAPIAETACAVLLLLVLQLLVAVPLTFLTLRRAWTTSPSIRERLRMRPTAACS